jgi:uncharacterized MAPEG superfamily protein
MPDPISSHTVLTTAHLCLVGAALLPIVCAGIAKWGFRRFDNHNPRDWLESQAGFRKRANAAQANSWEALVIFAPAVLTAMQTGAPQARVDTLAMLFIVARLAFILCYVTNQATLRSLVWAAGLGASIALFFAAR